MENQGTSVEDLCSLATMYYESVNVNKLKYYFNIILMVFKSKLTPLLNSSAFQSYRNLLYCHLIIAH